MQSHFPDNRWIDQRAARRLRSPVVSARLLVLVFTHLVAMLAAAAVTVAQRGNQLLLDGQPAALVFAHGCEDPAQLPRYRALGFNTLLIRIDSPGVTSVNEVDALMTAAEQAGLYIVCQLVNGGWSENQYANASDRQYTENAAYYLDQTVTRLKAHPNLVGWIIGTVEEGRLLSDIGRFADFLQAKYGSLQALNAAWSYQIASEERPRTVVSHIPSFSLLNEKTAVVMATQHRKVAEIVQADIKEYQQLAAANDANFQQYLQTRYATLTSLNETLHTQFLAWEHITMAHTLAQGQRNGPSPMVLLEIARYQSLAPSVTMDWWARQVKTRDEKHLVFAGAQRSYRTMISLPHSVNGIYTECYPGVAETDPKTHNPHAIDIARRGNQFIVLAGLRTRAAEAPQTFAEHLYMAAFHGAAGIGVADWATLAGSPPLAEAAQTVLTALWSRQLLGRRPSPRVAIVYTPYAPGIPPDAGKRPLYGYLSDFLYPGPGLLFFFLRQGTSYGQIDYLSADDLARVPLDGYRTILLPSVVDLPTPSQEALRRFVADGGTAVADIGLGTLQAGGDYQILPPQMTDLFGVRSVPGLTQVRLNLEAFNQPTARFPSLLPGQRSTGTANGYMITRTGRVIPIGRTDVLCTTVSSNNAGRPRPRPYTRPEQKPMSGLLLTAREKGYAVFAPFPLYQWWLPTNMLFEDFHRDLFGQGADVALLAPIDFLSPFAEIASYADGSVGVWTKSDAAPLVEVRPPLARHGEWRWAFAVLGGRCDIGPETTLLRYDEPGFHVARRLPITVTPVPFTVNFCATQSNQQGLAFDLGADAAVAAKPLTIRVGSGAYAIAPLSRHRVTVITQAGGHDRILQADKGGWLTLDLPQARCRILVTAADQEIEIQHPTSDGQVDDNGDLVIDPIPGT